MNESDFKIQDYLESPNISKYGFREYDARWLYPDQINLSGIKKFGASLGCLMHQEKVDPKIIVGHDYRSYSKEVKKSPHFWFIIFRYRCFRYWTYYITRCLFCSIFFGL